MEKVKLGIAGIGGRGYGFAEMAVRNPEADLVAVADTNEERARRAAANLGTSLQLYPTVEDLVEKADVDAIIIATPDYLHKDHALAAFGAGKHVLLEKPIATTVPDSLAILSAARRSHRILSMGFNLRHSPVVSQMRQLIVEEKVVGRPFYLTSVEYYNGGRTYMARWNRLKKYSGGLFVHKGTHDFDVINWVNEPARPKWVAASAAVDVLDTEHIPFDVKPGDRVGPYCQACKYNQVCPDRPGYMFDDAKGGRKPLFDEDTARLDGYHKDLCMYASEKDTHDNAMALLEYDNGSRSFHSEVFATARDNRQYVVIGDRGHLEADLGEHTITVYPRWTGNRVIHHVHGVRGGHGGSDPGLLGTFLRAVLTGQRPLADAVDGIWSLAAGLAAELSREQNRIVYLSELLDPAALE
jgi:predicted dehydrogenase